MLPDNTRFLELINSADPLSLVIKGHQAVETALNAAISEALPDPHALEIERLSFALKIDLAVALGAVREDSRPSLVQLNGVRNRFAHRMEASFDSKAATDLFNALSPWQRSALGTDLTSYTDPHETLREVIAVLFIELKTSMAAMQESKLAAEALREMVRETLANSPLGPLSSQDRYEVNAELQARVDAKKKDKRKPGPM